MSETTDEVKLCCSDLRVLGRKEFRSLLRWKTQVEKVLEKQNPKEAEHETEPEEEEEELDEDEKLDAELSTLEKSALAKERRRKKRVAEKKAKIREKLRLKMIDPDDNMDIQADQSLFTLKKLKNVNVNDVAEVSLNRVDAVLSEEEEEEADHGHQRKKKARHDSQFESHVEVEEAPEDTSRTRGSDSEEDNKYQEMEDEMDAMYTAYLAQKSTKGVLRTKRAKKSKKGEDDAEGSDDDLEENAENPDDKKSSLLVDLEQGAPISASKKAKLWFDQPLFQGVEDESDDDDIRAMNVRGVQTAPTKSQKRRGATDGDDSSDTDNQEGAEDDDDDDDDWSSDEKDSDDSEPELVDDDGDNEGRKGKTMTPEQMALASLMLSKKKKQMAIDDAYNRNAFNDDELPEWFHDDEKKHRMANIPVTKEDMVLYREKMKEIDARPIKKVAEAKARKKHKTTKKLERVKKQAAAIADSEDISEKQKLTQITKLYKSKMATVCTPLSFSFCFSTSVPLTFSSFCFLFFRS